MKVGDLVQFKADGVVLDMGIVSRNDEQPGYMWVDCIKMGPQRISNNSPLAEVVSEAR